MFLSDVDLRRAIERGHLIVNPPPDKEIGKTSIDLYLDSVEEAKVWDIERYAKDNNIRGYPSKELHVARMDYGKISREYMIPPPGEANKGDGLVFRRENAIIVKPNGFVIWQTTLLSR